MPSSHPRTATARFALRAATADAHDRVDALFSQCDLTGRAGYGAFLQAQAAAFLPIERAIDASDWGDAVPDWPARRRGALLLGDLAALGLPVPDANSTRAGPLAGTEAILGTVYVLEGSRLGGAVLVRAVPPGWPRAFLGAADPALWRGLIELLDRNLQNPAQLELAATAARKAFDMFVTSARQLAADIDG